MLKRLLACILNAYCLFLLSVHFDLLYSSSKPIILGLKRCLCSWVFLLLFQSTFVSLPPLTWLVTTVSNSNSRTIFWHPEGPNILWSTHMHIHTKHSYTYKQTNTLKGNQLYENILLNLKQNPHTNWNCPCLITNSVFMYN